MRIVLEEVFRPPKGEETEPVKLGEIVIYTEQLTPEQLIVCNNWPNKYKLELQKAGIEVE